MQPVETAVAARQAAPAAGDGAAIHVHGKFFFAGEAKFFVKGVTYGPFAPGSHGAQFPERETVIRDFRLMAEVGANTLRVFTVPPADFESWARHQAQGAIYPASATQPKTADASGGQVPLVHPVAEVNGQTPQAAAVQVVDTGYMFPKEKLPSNFTPQTPLPTQETFDMSMKGDPAAGFKTYSSQACIGPAPPNASSAKSRGS